MKEKSKSEEISPLMRDELARAEEKPKVVAPKAEAEIKVEEGVGAVAVRPTGEYEVIDSYKVGDNDVQIITTKTQVSPTYCVLLPELKVEDHKKIKEFVDTILKESRLDPATILDPEERKRIFSREIRKIIKDHEPTLPEKKLKIYSEYILMDMIGYGLLDPLLSDDLLEEVMLLGMDKRVYIAHRKHGMCSTNIIFHDEELAENIIQRMARGVGRKIDTMNPLLDARLADGSRVNATIPPVTTDGATLTIRKFREDALTVVDLLNFKTFSVDFAAWLWVVIDGLGIKPGNAIVAGGTGSGKTTTLNSLATFIPERDRVLTIEDTLELQLKPHEHWIRMETRPPNVEGRGEVTMNDLVVNTLRMRPDRIILGEVRGPEAATLFTAMNTGHDGCMGTLHANDARETITRLTNPPMNVPLIMIPALDLIIMQNRFKHPERGTLRRITEVAEIAGMEGDVVQLNRVFEYNPQTDVLEETGTPSRILQDIGERSARSGKEINMEIAKRAMCLKWMQDSNIRALTDVKEVILTFNRDPDGFTESITAGGM
ncbi:MAG: CpaF family protein [Candidatus Hydrothermarchaeales archaeon]